MGDVQGGQREQLHLLYVIGEVLGGEVLEKSYGGREEREGDWEIGERYGGWKVQMSDVQGGQRKQLHLTYEYGYGWEGY